MVPMNAIQQERERCAKLVENLMRRDDNQFLKEKLRKLRNRILNPRSTGTSGGPLTEQLELPFDY